MSNSLKRFTFVAFALAVLFAAFGSHSQAGVGQTQRDQIEVTVLLNITGVAKAPAAPDAGPPVSAPEIAAHIALRAKGSANYVDSDNVFERGSVLVAQQTQSAVKVEAEVSPNPMGTLLYSNNPMVTLNGTAGTTIKQSCAYQVTVDSVQASWTLKDGLSQSPTSAATSFPGTDISRNNYAGATPQPTSSPFTVYPTAWQNASTAGRMKTYCVDLSIAVPGSVPTGTYSTTAIYTVYW